MTPDSSARNTKRVTITDVARHAGVSTAAVSKVMRHAYGVSPAMQERVRTAMAELGYRPNAAARGMRGRTYTIGVLLDNVRNAFFADILDGIHEELDNSEYTVLIGAAGFGADEQARTIRSMVDRQMDGLVLIAPGTPRAEVLATAEMTPTVVIGHHDAAAVHDSVVDADDVGAGLAVDHLVALGHRDIALVSAAGSRATRWQRPRRSRWRTATCVRWTVTASPGGHACTTPRTPTTAAMRPGSPSCPGVTDPRRS